jgi:hypothetical protein
MADTDNIIGKWAVISSEDNVCVNTVLWDGSNKWTAPKGCFMVSLEGVDWYNIGAVYDKNTNSYTAADETEI